MANPPGRNDLCPCGSGRKFKKCCLNNTPGVSARIMRPDELPPGLLAEIERRNQQEQERIAQFGHVRPQISADFAGRKFVAVGSQLTWGNWKTFHDFLIDYLGSVFGAEWGNPELAKPFEERHPVAQWYHRLCDLQRKYFDSRDERGIYHGTATGPVKAYLALAYDLYTLRHHALLQQRLIERLKNPRQFQGARYEVYVAAAFVRAGYDITLEDEGDRSTSHCEFIAEHRARHKKYSVEAKSRHRAGVLGHPGTAIPLDEIEADVSGLLAKALRKEAEHDRIVFIDVNVPPEDGALPETSWARKLMRQVNMLEKQPAEPPWPSAFIFFTNHPYHYVVDTAPEPRRDFLVTAINITEFKQPDGQIAATKYPDIAELFRSVTSHGSIPHEFEETAAAQLSN